MAEEGDPNPLAVLSPPHWVINEDDHGGYVIIATWVMMSYMVLTVAVRLIRKISIAAWALDDYIISAAAISGLIQSGMLHKAVASGLGKRQSLLSDEQLDTTNKYTYVFQILFILTIVLSKISLLQFIGKLIPNANNILAARVLMGVSAVWGVGTILALAFQCGMPTPWNYTGVCKSQGPVLYSAGIIDLITDFAITILPLLTLVNVQMQRDPKFTVMAVFIVRFTVCIAEIPRLLYVTKYVESSDPIYGIVDLAIWTQAVSNLSLATACIPCLKPFLSSMRSGVFNTALPAGFEGGLTYTLESSQQGTSGNHNLSRDLYGSKKQVVSNTTVESSSKIPQRSESKRRLTEEDRIYKTTEFTIDNNDGKESRNGSTVTN